MLDQEEAEYLAKQELNATNTKVRAHSCRQILTKLTVVPVNLLVVLDLKSEGGVIRCAGCIFQVRVYFINLLLQVCFGGSVDMTII